MTEGVEGRQKAEGAELSPELLRALYKQAFDEYRAEVALGWDRQKFFLTLNLAVLAAATSIIKLQPGSPYGWMPAVLLLMCVPVALLGHIVVDQGHRRYRRTREVFQSLETRLRLPPDVVLQTTEGMRGEREAGLRVPRITDASKGIFLLFALVEAAMAVAILAGS